VNGYRDWGQVFAGVSVIVIVTAMIGCALWSVLP